MQTIDDRISEIEKEIRETPYHKGTEHHIGKLKARIAKLKEEQIEKFAKGGGSGGGGYAIRKTGNATVVLVGPPSVGKSTLLNKITNAESKVGAYDFTTLNVIPGMLDFRGAKIQIFDVPGIVSGAASGKGRGKEVLSVARGADLILIMVDVKTINLVPAILKELYEAGVRLNEKKPEVTIIKQASGGIKVNATTQLKISYDTIKSLANEFRLANAEVIIREDITLDRLIDAFVGSRAYLPYLIVINKVDLGIPKNLNNFLPIGCKPVLISSEINENLEQLKERIWQSLGFIRIYLKEDDFIDYEKPVITKKEIDLKSMLEEVSIRRKETFKSAKIYGPGAKYPGQEVSLTFIPQDGTIVQFLA
ncbi:MAG: 50S ribosome-binding GTPase [Patescibacteria group bacterium]|nr:50S ribosome-binding GTPase [Patescibacteria group bacterium]